VKTFVTLFCCPAAWILGIVPACAEVIHLKNGDIVYADQVKDNGKTITYEVGDNTYTIPKALVQDVDKTPAPRQSDFPISPGEMPAYMPSAQAVDSRQLDHVISNGEVRRLLHSCPARVHGGQIQRCETRL
jgi:hypothetical protein